jgi:hypothetical protein
MGTVFTRNAHYRQLFLRISQQPHDPVIPQHNHLLKLVPWLDMADDTNITFIQLGLLMAHVPSMKPRVVRICTHCASTMGPPLLGTSFRLTPSSLRLNQLTAQQSVDQPTPIQIDPVCWERVRRLFTN